MALTILGPFLGSFVCFCVCFIYPAYLSVQLLLDDEATASGPLKSYHIQHVVFWMLYSWVFCVESLSPVAFLAQYLPFYYEIKCVLFYWLASPQFKGAGWLWLHVINPAYEKSAPVCSRIYRERFPPQVKAAIEKAKETVVGTKGLESDAFNKSRQPSKAAGTSKAD